MEARTQIKECHGVVLIVLIQNERNALRFRIVVRVFQYAHYNTQYFKRDVRSQLRATLLLIVFISI